MHREHIFYSEIPGSEAWWTYWWWAKSYLGVFLGFNSTWAWHFFLVKWWKYDLLKSWWKQRAFLLGMGIFFSAEEMTVWRTAWGEMPAPSPEARVISMGPPCLGLWPTAPESVLMSRPVLPPETTPVFEGYAEPAPHWL